MKYKPSPEQAAYREALQTSSAHIILEAVAGSGKTATLVDNLDANRGSIALMAFNKKIAAELEERVKLLSIQTRLNTEVKTMHAMGLQAYRSGGQKPQIEGGKLNFLLKDMLSDYEWEHPFQRSKGLIKQLCSLAKNNGFGCRSPHELFSHIEEKEHWQQLAEHYGLDLELEQTGMSMQNLVLFAQRLLKQSNQMLRKIDFDDMIYLPLLMDLPLKRFSNVIVDEAQDTNLVRREMAFRMLREDGRLIAVGDRHQAIYGFTGADAYALDNIKKRCQKLGPTEELPLSVCWRCDQKIIEHAQKWVPHITSFDKESRGSVTQMEFSAAFVHGLQPGDAVLCRLNKPNVSLAIALLRLGKAARIEGRDLGEKLLSHARKAAPDLPPLDELQLALESYKRHQIDLLLSKERESQAAFLEDELDALDILLDRCLEQGKKRYSDLETLCHTLFEDDAHKKHCVLLCSVHKSKGLEWPRVYLLGRSDYMPFWRATLEWELEQEANLIYVAVTRAKHELIEVTGVQAALDKGVKSITQLPAEEQQELLAELNFKELRNDYERGQEQ